MTRKEIVKKISEEIDFPNRQSYRQTSKSDNRESC